MPDNHVDSNCVLVVVCAPRRCRPTWTQIASLSLFARRTDAARRGTQIASSSLVARRTDAPRRGLKLPRPCLRLKVAQPRGLKLRPRRSLRAAQMLPDVDSNCLVVAVRLKAAQPRGLKLRPRPCLGAAQMPPPEMSQKLADQRVRREVLRGVVRRPPAPKLTKIWSTSKMWVSFVPQARVKQGLVDLRGEESRRGPRPLVGLRPRT